MECDDRKNPRIYRGKVKAAEALAKDGAGVAVVSMPCWELFEQQPEEYQQAVLGNEYRVAIEAASPMGWDRWTGRYGRVIGMQGFGASGKAEDLYTHFGITAEAVRDEVRCMLQI